MKQLDHITLVNGLSEIYQLFTQLYPELVLQVKEWYQWGGGQAWSGHSPAQ